ncbi:MAG: right-handed parallel beta-helix repeat-containing protein [Opitutus sp.]|nr:right-handed parallel beta-helix repeat-containing protein [Opitutus sp.]
MLAKIFGVVALAAGLTASGADFYVAPNGDDANPGTERKPFATLVRARNAVRDQKARAPNRDYEVALRGGVYQLRETAVFTLADSAADGRTITYAAYPNETPVLSSGVPIRTWRRLREDPAGLPAVARGKLWVADVPAELERILTLYDGAERLPRARSDGFTPRTVPGQRTVADQISFPPGALKSWPDVTEGELLVIPTADYEMCILPLATVDERTSLATTAFPASRPIGAVKFMDRTAWVENVLAVLDEPGEWVLHAAERKIYFWPRGENPGDGIVAPQLTELIRVAGAIDYDGPRDTPVRGLRFRGLTFRHAERFPWRGQTGWSLQHHWEMFDRPTAAVRFRGAEDCAVEACRFVGLGGTAVRLDLHCRQIRIAHNEIGQVGGVGVLLAGYGPGTKDVNRENEIVDNWIHHTGEIYWATPAVMVWQSSANRVANNLIHHTPYSAITVSTRAAWAPANVTSDGSRTVRWSEVGDPQASLTWSARERFLHARGNLVERNDIHHIMERLGDGNGVYVSGTGGQNLIRQNYIHDIDSDGLSDGIRCDDFQDDTTIEGNLIVRIRRIGQGICSKGVNHILNNIVADLLPSRRTIRPERVVRASLGLEVSSVTGSRIERNIVFAPRADFPVYTQDRRYGTGREPRLRDCQADYNLYFCAEDPAWGRRHLATEQPLGVETHSLAVDPLFVSRETGDYRLQPDSPALKLGFRPIDLSQIGLWPNHPYHRP